MMLRRAGAVLAAALTGAELLAQASAPAELGTSQYVARRGHSTLLICCAAIALMLAGCSAAASQTPPKPLTEHVAGNRFTVVLSATALQEAKAAGVSLPGLVARDLDHINSLLPGPRTTITVNYSNPQGLITETGTNGSTSNSGKINIWFGPTRQASIHKALTWLAQAFSHEVDHSVRALAGPGLGSTLLAQIITEGISSVFDGAAFPGLPDPWDSAISQSQECALWNKAQSQLGSPIDYDQWMFGGDGVPHWAGFAIGYHLVRDYLTRHPGTSWAALNSATAPTILLGSDYQPCTA